MKCEHSVIGRSGKIYRCCNFDCGKEFIEKPEQPSPQPPKEERGLMRKLLDFYEEEERRFRKALLDYLEADYKERRPGNRAHVIEDIRDLYA